ncbi:MAG: PH domain-containing protein [Chloroflexota bacterium]|nr:PH domain-containing protein [Chloroflexota bacterium]
MRPPPAHHLDPRARTAWRIAGALLTAVVLAVVVAVGYVLLRFTAFPPWLVWTAGGLAVAAAAASVWPVPDIEWRHWRYEIGEREVDLQHGWIVVTRTLVPMAQIQHVDTRRGPLERRFGLATVVLYTAAGASEIPALADAEAAEVRDRISALANLNQQL